MLGYKSRLFLRQRVPLVRFIIRKKWLCLALALIPIVVVVGGVIWAAPKLRTRQSQDFLKIAERYLSAGQTRDAVMSLKSSLRLVPDNPGALRLLARIQTSQGDPASLDNWNKLLATGKVQLEDIIMSAEVAVKQQDWALADRLADATAVNGNKALSHLIKAGLLRAKGDPALVEAELRLAVEKDTGLNSKRALAKFLISQPLNNEKSQQIFDILREVSKVQDDAGADALATALMKGVVPSNEIPNWIAAIRAHSKSSQRNLCLADYTEVVYGLAPSDSVAIKLHARVEKQPLQDRLEAMEWLFRLGKSDMAARIISPSEALQAGNSYYIWLDASLMKENWQDVLKSLNSQQNPIKESYLINLYKAKTLYLLGRKQESEDLFLSVYEQVKQDRVRLLKSLVFFNTSDQKKLFVNGLRNLLSDDKNAVISFKALLPSIYLQRDSVTALHFYELAASISPQLAADMALQNDLLYLRILMGKEQNGKAAAALSQANPMDQSLRVTHAFAVFKSGNAVEAQKVLEASEQGIAASTLLPHEKAVVAAILAANGRKKEAELVSRMVQPNELSIQEIQLVQSQFQKLDAKESASPSSRQSSPSNAMNGSTQATKKFK